MVGRDQMNVDDIDGAMPKRLAGYTGARPDVLMQKELQDSRFQTEQMKQYAAPM